MRKSIHNNSKFILFIGLLILASCVKVDLCNEEIHPHVVGIKIEYHWPDSINMDEKPDSMLVLVNRIINTKRVGYVTNAESSQGGRYRFGKVHMHEETLKDKDNSNSKDSINTPDDSLDVVDMYPLKISAGDYQIFAFNNDIVDAAKDVEGNKKVEDYSFEKLEEYSNEASYAHVGIRDLSIAYVGRNRDDSRLNMYGKDWVDFNPYTQYIASDIKPIYRAMNVRNENTQEFTIPVRANETPKNEVVIDLYPEKITQDITFSFPIYTDKGVVIDSILAEISGIPSKMMLYSGVLDISKTYKMLFKVYADSKSIEDSIIVMEEKGDQIYEIKKSVLRFECLGDVSVMGLLPNNNPKHATGAGILQLCMYVHTTDDYGEIKTKARYAKINLYNTLNGPNGKKLLVKNQNGEIVQRVKKDTIRFAESRLLITRDLVLQTSDDDISVDTWIRLDENDIDIDI